MIEFYKKLGVHVAAYSPICPTEVPNCPPEFKDLNLLKDSTIQEISKRYNKSAGQVVLNWHINREHLIFPKMKTKEQLAENREIFNFKLDEADY